MHTNDKFAYTFFVFSSYW